MENEYIFLVYKNPGIDTCEQNNYKYVVANRDILHGELLLIEHVLIADNNTCFSIIKNNEYLFDRYHPRTTKFNGYNFKDGDDKNKLTNTKIQHNCFGYEKDELLMSDNIASINHSCDPNSAVYLQKTYKAGNTNIVFMEVYSVRSIKKDTEITISYGAETSHKRDFECKCGKELPEREKIFKIVSNLAGIFSDKNKKFVAEKVCEYLKEPISKKILLNHYLSEMEIFFDHDFVSSFTENGKKLINDIVYKNLENDIPLANKLPKEDKINNEKIKIFLTILNNGLLNDCTTDAMK
ncbi:MAG: hypothetical protein Satyrvirus32_6 [Satyrvirus sp.]|uniref:SET domain-containing protein n=1 Tax=Satyrvirus sp. TaxID=2487771 RepID=A0A3G5AER0_9VIRU|nr:MAG: hypothetical protein Satyrvirus32_6 [Satyrvirus sp.]